MKIVIDADPGIDDAVALALAARSPEVDLLAVTATFGNTTVERAARNARLVLDRAGAPRVPVYIGAGRPLLRPLSTAAETHGDQGLGHAQVPPLLPPGSAGPAGQNRSGRAVAPGALLEILERAGEPVTLVALGPLTNVALALALDRALLRQCLAEVVVMGGAVAVPGNTTPVSEFNFWADPEAAHSVLHSGLQVRLVGLDVTRRCVLSNRAVRRLAESGDAEHRWWAAALRYYVDFHRASEDLDGCILNDPLALALLIQPGWGETLSVPVEVALGWDQTRGQSVCDRFQITGAPVNARVYLRVQALAAMVWMARRVWGEVLDEDDLRHGVAMAEARWGAIR